MIRIHKSSTPPAILRQRGRREAQRLKALYDASPDEYIQGKTFPIDRTIYGATAVKEALRKDQHEKCAFCESKFSHVGYGDVEHLRPKRGYKQHGRDRLRYPGYYWLVYEWTNLFYSCQLCNQRFKKNLFPLQNPHRRARCHHHDISAEKPLLVDPAAVDPSLFVTFRNEYARPLKRNPIGRRTIAVLGLNRKELIEVRRDRLRTIRVFLQMRARLERHIAKL
ncbi:MAG TPA: hypothetical protein VMF69_18535, partial [Gemmataceae bacterium]|nr:hypothetical protein [Gemmataceae bacterium]